uniref:Terpene synthase 1 n=1 Tax=Chiococca alba TaxID=28527 RepID=A0A6M3EX94_CHIAL|nr:terpene synthase 1 [Chiococca alba]
MSSSTSAAATLLGLSPASRRFVSFPPANGPIETITGIWSPGKALHHFNFRLRCSTVSSPRTQELGQVSQNGMSGIKWHDIVEEGVTEKGTLEANTSSWIKESIEAIRWMLRTMDDGDISISAYDTAWVALVEDINGSGGPQFPSSLEWIANNQLPDGSWGDSDIFSAHDRILNTLGCVVALKSWNMHPEKSEKGLLYLRDNIHKLEDENVEHMPIGFEVAFPSLIEIAKKLSIDIPDDSAILQEIYARRNLKLTRIPKDIMHTVPTTLLHSLEGMPELDWKRLISLKCEDGSFLFSPSSTAFALTQTKDADCLRYLTKTVQKFNGGVPNVYPVDLFEHIWAVDRLQRLGISRYFQSEIRECIDYVHRYWTDKGICWARNTHVYDIDDTAMGFRLLRLHGYDVSADVFRYYEKDGEFVCFAGQSNQAVTGMYNLYRASQVMFPGENILSDARKFSSEFLHDKRANNELLDKWIITKDLPGEVAYALDVPWYASLPRLETRLYLEQYGGEDDVWIGKTLYRMQKVNNNIYLELGKLDYNNCQALHQLEWRSIQKWYNECGLGEYGLSERSLLLSYYLAAASIFEPERSKERLAWAKTTMLIRTIESYLSSEQMVEDHNGAFVSEFQYYCSNLDYVNGGRHKPTQRLVRTLLGTLNQISLDAVLVHGRDIHQYLRQAWEKWLIALQEGDDSDMGQEEAELLVRTLNLCAGRYASEELLLSHPKYQQLLHITTRVCNQIRHFQHKKVQDGENGRANMGDGITSISSIESDMQELTKLVVGNTQNDLDADTKQTFLTVAKSFYYTAHCNPGTINCHIAKVLFERVL